MRIRSVQSRKDLLAERDAARAERDQACAERDALARKLQEVPCVVDEHETLKAERDAAREDAERLAQCVRFYPGKATPMDRADALVAHDALVAEQDR